MHEIITKRTCLRENVEIETDIPGKSVLQKHAIGIDERPQRRRNGNQNGSTQKSREQILSCVIICSSMLPNSELFATVHENFKVEPTEYV